MAGERPIKTTKKRARRGYTREKYGQKTIIFSEKRNWAGEREFKRESPSKTIATQKIGGKRKVAKIKVRFGRSSLSDIQNRRARV